jgi:hypothetical protein
MAIMALHRFADLLNPTSSVATAEPEIRLPVSGFMVCPPAVQQWLCGQDVQWHIYQQALEQALALARPSILDRMNAALMN